VIDVGAGDDIPVKTAQALCRRMVVINKIDTPYVGADLDLIRKEAAATPGQTDCLHELQDWVGAGSSRQLYPETVLFRGSLVEGFAKSKSTDV